MVKADMVDFFEVLDLPPACEVDMAALEKNYRSLQSQWHPDRFAGAEQKQKLEAVQRTSLINDAYSTLKSPLKRASHLLQLQGIELDSQAQSHLDPSFLLTQMELRDDLEANIESTNISALEVMRADIKNQQEALWEEFSANVSAADYQQAQRVFYKMQFMLKLLDEVRSAEDKLLGY